MPRNRKSPVWRWSDAAPRQGHQAMERECGSQRPHQPVRLLERDGVPYQERGLGHGSEYFRCGLRESGPFGELRCPPGVVKTSFNPLQRLTARVKTMKNTKLLLK